MYLPSAVVTYVSMIAPLLLYRVITASASVLLSSSVTVPEIDASVLSEGAALGAGLFVGSLLGAELGAGLVVGDSLGSELGA